MKYPEITKFDEPIRKIQFDLTGAVLKPILWLDRKITGLIRELRFFQYSLKFGQREDDIYVSTYLKSGTTLMQMILYQMTTDGSVEFDHIYDVSPWIRNDVHRGKPPLNFPSPRIIKTHDPYDDFEKGTKGRFIHVIRNGQDVAVSFFHQNKNYVNPDLKFEDNFKKFFVSNNHMNWFSYSQKWLENKKGFNILYVRYEDLIENKRDVIYKIAEFLKVKLTEEIINRTLERSSFEFMKLHETKFGEQPVERVFNQFIRKGKIGEGNDYMNEKQKKYYQKQFEKKLAGLLEKRFRKD